MPRHSISNIFSYKPKGGARRGRRIAVRRRARPHWRTRKPTIYKGVSTQANIPRIQKFRYTDVINIDPAVGAPAYRYFSTNSLFKPDPTGGHKPMRFNEMAAFYDHYVVLGSKIMVKKVGKYAVSVASTPNAWGIYVNDDTIAPGGSYTTLVESGRSSFRVANATNSSNPQTQVMKFSTKRFWNLTNVKDNVARLGATVLLDPSDQAYFALWCQAMDVSGDPPTETYLVTIDYIALMSEPADMAQS